MVGSTGGTGFVPFLPHVCHISIAKGVTAERLQDKTGFSFSSSYLNVYGIPVKWVIADYHRSLLHIPIAMLLHSNLCQLLNYKPWLSPC